MRGAPLPSCSSECQGFTIPLGQCVPGWLCTLCPDQWPPLFHLEFILLPCHPLSVTVNGRILAFSPLDPALWCSSHSHPIACYAPAVNVPTCNGTLPPERYFCHSLLHNWELTSGTRHHVQDTNHKIYPDPVHFPLTFHVRRVGRWSVF